MLYCNQCGGPNPDDSEFCNKCGSRIIKGKSAQPPEKGPKMAVSAKEPRPQEPVPEPTMNFERVSRTISEEFEHFGKTLGDRFERMGKDWETSFDRMFGVIGPLITSVIGFGVLVLLILATQQLGYVNVRIYLVNNLFVFFGLILLFNYIGYINRKYKRPMRWVHPVTVGVGISIGFWVISEINFALFRDTGISTLSSIGSAFQVLAVVALVLVIVVGYILTFIFTPEKWRTSGV